MKHLQQHVRQFVTDVLEPAVAQIERDNVVPTPVVEAAAELGLFGLSIPRDHGGVGLTLTEKCQLEELLGGAHYGFATVLGNHNGVGTAGIVESGTPEQKQRYLPRMATGSLRGAFCLTEPQAGSDAGSLTTTAKRTDSGWVINGDKTLITQATVAGVFTVAARTDEGVTSFLVDADMPGVAVLEATPILGLRGSTVAPVVFRDVEVGPHALLGTEGRGLRQSLESLNRGRIAMSARVFGLGSRALQAAIEYANGREQFGRRLIDNQGLAWRLAELSTEMDAARMLLYRAAQGIDAADYRFRDVAMAKYYVTEIVGRVVDQAMQVFGGLGYTEEAPVERYFRDARVTRIYEGASEIQLDIIARSLRA